MTRPAAWIDITASDAGRSRDFYAGLFGWPIDVVEEMDYGVVAPGAERLPGGIGQAGDGHRHPVGMVTYFTVDDVPASLERAIALGATAAVEPWEVPGMGTMAVVLDPDGTRVGLWRPAP
jgi:uncharacterized protein